MSRTLRRAAALRVGATALTLAALAFSGCSCGDLLFGYTGLVFTPDGQSLVVGKDDALFIATPPDAEPERLIGQGCGPGYRGVGCVRISPDSRRMAALFSREGEARRDLRHFTLRGDSTQPPLVSVVPGTIASDALDADFTPDGRELIWATPRPGVEESVALWRLGPDGEPQELVSSIWVGADKLNEAMGAAVLTPYGVGYPRKVDQATALWFKPFDDTAFQIGTLPASCAGAQLRRCVMASGDGGTLAWQEKSSGILDLFAAKTQALLPLGQAWGFSFARSGRYALRIDYASAVVQNVDTAVVVRRVDAAGAAQISNDGETLAWLVPESTVVNSVRLFAGSSRQDAADRDLDVYEASAVRPLVPGTSGTSPVDLAMTGDALWAVLGTRGSGAGSAQLLAVGLASAEKVPLGEVDCDSCCAVAPAGALAACAIPGARGETALHLFDVASGRRTVAVADTLGAQFLFDGSGVAVLDASGPALWLVMKDGRREKLGNASDFAVSPASGYVAWLSLLGGLDVRRVPR